MAKTVSRIFFSLLALWNSIGLACETDVERIVMAEELIQDEEFHDNVCRGKPCFPAKLVQNDALEFSVVKVSYPPYKVCVVSDTSGTKERFTGIFFLKDSKWNLSSIDYISSVSVVDSFPVGLRIWTLTDHTTQEGDMLILEWDGTKFMWLKSVHFKPLASFSCENWLSEDEKTITNVEKTICANETLSRLDSALSSNYNEIQSVNDKQKYRRFQSTQSAWLKQRNACNTVECLLDSYTRRITELCANYPPASDGIPPCISAIEAETFFREITR